METNTPTQSILARWSPRKLLADDLGIAGHVVSRWFTRSSIPPQHYAGILESARKRKIRLALRELVDARNGHNCQIGISVAENQPAQKDNFARQDRVTE